MVAIPGPAPARPAPGGVLVVCAFLFWFGIQQILVLLAGAVPGGGPPVRAILVALALTNAISIVALPVLLRKGPGTGPVDLGLTGVGAVLRGLGMGLALALVVLPFIFGIMHLATRTWPPHPHPMEEMLRRDRSAATALVAILGGGLLAPVAEELLFRGLLQRWIAGRLGSWGETAHGPRTAGFWANVLTSLIFAAIHLEQWPAPIPLFCLAIALGESYRRSGNLGVPIGLHMALNGVSTAVLLAHPASPI